MDPLECRADPIPRLECLTIADLTRRRVLALLSIIVGAKKRHLPKGVRAELVALVPKVVRCFLPLSRSPLVSSLPSLLVPGAKEEFVLVLELWLVLMVERLSSVTLLLTRVARCLMDT